MSGITVPSVQHFRKAGSAGLALWPGTQASEAQQDLSTWQQALQTLPSRVPNRNAGFWLPCHDLRGQKITGFQPGFLMTTVPGAAPHGVAAAEQMSTARTQSTDPLKQGFEVAPKDFHF